MAKVKRHRRKDSGRVLDNIKAQRGLDRKAHFANGGTLVAWRGGPRLVQVDKVKEASKNSCRKWRA